VTVAEIYGRHHLTMHPVPEWVPDPEPGSDEPNRWMFHELEPGASFGFLYLMVLEHLRRCRLYSPELMKYLNSFFLASFSRYEALT
jgi:hypothetical protein